MPFDLVAQHRNQRFIIEEFVHRGCGARFFKVHDNVYTSNFTFALHLNTPPENSKGIYHIIEHSVFCGSYNYNVKEPFKNMLQASFQTFLNAATYAEHTEYPVASTNYSDFKNMVAVYMDAILHPNLLSNKAVFLYEGLNRKQADGFIVHNGIVLSEMLADYGDLVQKCFAIMRSMLLKGTSLEFDSAGDPEQIINLTYEEVVDYYLRFYRADNMCIIIHGNSDIADDLVLLDSFLPSSNYQLSNKPDGYWKEIAPIKRREINSCQKTTSICFGGVLGLAENFQSYERTIFDLLSYVLFTSDGAAITNYFQENELCDYLICEFSVDGPIYWFTILLQNVDSPGALEDLQGALRTCFRQLCGDEKGALSNVLTNERLYAVIQVLEFESKEIDEDFSVEVCGALANGVLYNRDPLFYLSSEEDNTKMRYMLADGSLVRVVKEYIRRYFANQELSVLVVNPGRSEQSLQIPCDSATSAACDEEQTALSTYQDAVDSPYEIAKLPFLRISELDIDGMKHQFAETFDHKSDRVIIVNNHDESVVRMDLLFNISQLINESNYQCFYILQKLLFNLPTSKYKTIASLQTKIDSTVGGLDAAIRFMDRRDCDACDAFLDVEVRFQSHLAKEAIELIAHMLKDFSFALLHGYDKVSQELGEMSSMLELYYTTDDVHEMAAWASSQRLVSSRVMWSFFSPEYASFLAKVSSDGDDDQAFDALIPALDQCFAQIVAQERRIFLVADAAAIERYKIAELAENAFLTNRDLSQTPPLATYRCDPPRYVIARTGASYVSATYQLTNRSGIFPLLLHYLETSLCWDVLRVKNGAYGCILGSSPRHLTITSYRDPNPVFTVDFLQNLHQHLSAIALEYEELDRIKIGCLAKIQTPATPAGIYERAKDLFLKRADVAEKTRQMEQIYRCTVQQFMQEIEVVECDPVISVVGCESARPLFPEAIYL